MVNEWKAFVKDDESTHPNTTLDNFYIVTIYDEDTGTFSTDAVYYYPNRKDFGRSSVIAYTLFPKPYRNAWYESRYLTQAGSL